MICKIKIRRSTLKRIVLFVIMISLLLIVGGIGNIERISEYDIVSRQEEVTNLAISIIGVIMLVIVYYLGKLWDIWKD